MKIFDTTQYLQLGRFVESELKGVGFCYNLIRLMDQRIIVQFVYWHKFRLVPNGMNYLQCKNIWLKDQNNPHNGSIKGDVWTIFYVMREFLGYFTLMSLPFPKWL